MKAYELLHTLSRNRRTRHLEEMYQRGGEKSWIGVGHAASQCGTKLQYAPCFMRNFNKSYNVFFCMKEDVKNVPSVIIDHLSENRYMPLYQSRPGIVVLLVFGASFLKLDFRLNYDNYNTLFKVLLWVS